MNMEELMLCVVRGVVKGCGERYGFDVEEALKEVKISVEKGCSPMPFVGVLLEGCCHGVRQNYGLLTQCEKKSEKKYCVSCERQAEKNASGKPDHGSIEDRMEAYECGKEYRSPKGKSPIAYAKVMEKLGLKREDVEAEAKRKNVVLRESDFEVAEKKRGRPKKTETSESKGPRGRPKKTKKVEVAKTEDLFASLISEAKANNTQVEAKEKPKMEEPNREEAVKVKRFEFNGKKYLRTSDNVLYDEKTQECMGVFNEERQEIDECDEEEEEEEEE
jgi:hypothetical protein